MDEDGIRRVAAMDQTTAAVTDLARLAAVFYRTLRAERIPVHVARELTRVALAGMTRAGRAD